MVQRLEGESAYPRVHPPPPISGMRLSDDLERCSVSKKGTGVVDGSMILREATNEYSPLSLPPSLPSPPSSPPLRSAAVRSDGAAKSINQSTNQLCGRVGKRGQPMRSRRAGPVGRRHGCRQPRHQRHHHGDHQGSVPARRGLLAFICFFMFSLFCVAELREIE